MPLELMINKVSGIGEQITASVKQWNPVTGEIAHSTMDEMLELFNQTLDRVDWRMQEMNLRVVEVSGFRKYCTPEEWEKVFYILQFISGKMSMDAIVERFYSRQEENAALEAGRLAAAVQSNGHYVDDESGESGESDEIIGNPS